MSVQEIIDRLPQLSAKEREEVEERLRELREENKVPGWGAVLLEVAGTAEGLPSDYAENHDHYLHGLPKK